MSTFRHHPDGFIFIDELQIPIAKFMELEPEYSLPQGFIRREYIQGVRHSLYTGSTQKGSTFPWPEGNAYILKKQAYADAIAAPIVEPEEPTLEEQVAQEVISAGYDINKTIEALVRAVGRDDRTLLDDLISKIDAAEVKVSKQVEATPQISPRIQ